MFVILATLRIFIEKDSKGFFQWTKNFKEIEKIIKLESCFLIDECKKTVGIFYIKEPKNDDLIFSANKSKLKNVVLKNKAHRVAGTDLFNKEKEIYNVCYTYIKKISYLK